MTVSDFSEQIQQMQKNLPKNKQITPESIYQTGVKENREIIGSMLDNLILPGSGVIQKENLIELFKLSQSGKACMLLIEHYSNFDYPAFYRLIEKDPDLGPEIASSLLPIQGMKLSESSDVTSAFSRSYDTIIIYPSRAMDNITDEEELKKIKEVSMPINHAAIKELTRRKHEGRMITVFPAGTRYRPWVPESKKGVREIFSYLKTFDYGVFISINGNTLRPCREENMALDEPTQDVMLFTVSEPVKTKEIRKTWQSEAPEETDSRQYVVDKVMDTLFSMHEENEKEHLQRLNQK